MSSGIQHSCCMLNRLSHCSVDFVRELRSHSAVSFLELSLIQPIIIAQIAHAPLALALARLRLSARHVLSLRYVAAVSLSLSERLRDVFCFSLGP